jgi:phosphopantothenate synthetase
MSVIDASGECQRDCKSRIVITIFLDQHQRDHKLESRMGETIVVVDQNQRDHKSKRAILSVVDACERAWDCTSRMVIMIVGFQGQKDCKTKMIIMIVVDQCQRDHKSWVGFP